MDTNHLEDLLQELINLPHETEWVEFKQNNSKPDDVGEYLSALSNSAAFHGKQTASMVWGRSVESRHKTIQAYPEVDHSSNV